MVDETPSAFLEARARDWDELRRELVVGYVTAAATAVIAVLFIGSDHGNWWLVAVAPFAIACAIYLVLAQPSVTVMKLIGMYVPIILISYSVAAAKPTGPAMMYFIWPALVTGHYGSRRDAVLSSVVLWTTFALAIAFGHDIQVPVLTFFSIVSIFGIILIAYRLQRLRTDELTLALAHAASTDSLTGLLNRRTFMEAFEREVARAQTSELPLTLIVFDLDHFKQLNDHFGHATGDDALRAFAEVLEKECSAGDLVARLGGEEFAVVLFDCDTSAAERTAQRIAGELALWSHSGVGTRLTTSAGVATLGRHGDDTAALLLSGDRALYVAKNNGRNRVAASGGDIAREFAAVA